MARPVWLAPTLTLVLVVTVLRLVLLAFNRTDLFVDEAQYWLWGRNLDWGYYSKPPLIGWLIGAVTRLAHSDSPLIIRLPGAILHGTTALILAQVAARRIGPDAALPTAAVYILSPFAALGSLLISTDTVMLPLLATALYFHARLLDKGRLRWAILTGAAIGLACMAKYAGVYMLLGLLLAMVFPESRLSWQSAAAITVTALLVLSPNLIWNATHHFTTFTHTSHNIGWIEDDDPAAHPGAFGSLSFLASQFGVFGPITFAALLFGLFRWRGRVPPRRDLIVLAVLPLLVVLTQAWLGKAYANWALAAYVSGSVLAATALLGRRVWLHWALGLNAVVSLVLPMLTLVPDLPLAGKPALARYLGRADLSAQIIALDKVQDGLPIVSANRDVLADLFYTGRQAGLVLYSAPGDDEPDSYYDQNYALPDLFSGDVLLVATQLPTTCQTTTAPTMLNGTGTWAGRGMQVFRLPAACLRAAP